MRLKVATCFSKIMCYCVLSLDGTKGGEKGCHGLFLALETECHAAIFSTSKNSSF